METCCTHNMLRLTRSLYAQEPRAAYFDYFERALFNGILASQDPDSGMQTYFQATRPGYVKLFHTPFDSFWCCTGSGIENHARYGENIYAHDGATLYVNLFIASSLDWKELGIPRRSGHALSGRGQYATDVPAIEAARARPSCCASPPGARS